MRKSLAGNTPPQAGAGDQPGAQQPRFDAPLGGYRVDSGTGSQCLQADRPTAIDIHQGIQITPVDIIQPQSIHPEHVQRFGDEFLVKVIAAYDREVVTSPEQPQGQPRGSAGALGDHLQGRCINERIAHCSSPADDLGQFAFGVEIDGEQLPETSPQRGGQQTEVGRCAHQCELAQTQRDRLAAFVQFDPYREILHCGVKHLCNVARERMDFIQEQDITLVQGSQYLDEFGGFRDGRSSHFSQAATHFVGDNRRQGGFAQPGAAVEADMLQHGAPGFGRLQHQPQRGLQRLLPDEVSQGLGPPVALVSGSSRSHRAPPLVGDRFDDPQLRTQLLEDAPHLRFADILIHQDFPQAGIGGVLALHTTAQALGLRCRVDVILHAFAVPEQRRGVEVLKGLRHLVFFDDAFDP